MASTPPWPPRARDARQSTRYRSTPGKSAAKANLRRFLEKQVVFEPVGPLPITDSGMGSRAVRGMASGRHARVARHPFRPIRRRLISRPVGTGVDFGNIKRDPESPVTFWVRAIARKAMPLHWRGWAVSVLQAAGKTGDRIPVDCQISLYHPGCDVFVTSTVFVSIIDAIWPVAPIALPAAHLLPSKDFTPPALVQLLTYSGSHRPDLWPVTTTRSARQAAFPGADRSSCPACSRANPSFHTPSAPWGRTCVRPQYLVDCTRVQ